MYYIILFILINPAELATTTETPYNIKLVTSIFRGISKTGLSASISSSPSSCTKNCTEATPKYVVGLTAGLSTSILILVLLIIFLIAVLLIYNKIRKSAKQNPTLEHQDGPESPQLEANANPYEQVHLSELIPSAESEAISNKFWQPQADLQGIYSCIDTERSYPLAKPVTQVTEKTTFDNPTYDNSRKESSKEQEINDRQDGLPVPLNSQNFTSTNDKESSLVENEPKLGDEVLEGIYAVVNKKKREEDEDAPPVPPHTTEELYTAVVKTSKVIATGDKENTLKLPIPSETDSNNNTENEEVAPQLPPHTVEELYTAVQKKPKKGAEDEEEAPPIPPYMVDNL